VVCRQVSTTPPDDTPSVNHHNTYNNTRRWY
jgi:hypothetical protein